LPHHQTQAYVALRFVAKTETMEHLAVSTIAIVPALGMLVDLSIVYRKSRRAALAQQTKAQLVFHLLILQAHALRKNFAGETRITAQSTLAALRKI